jgi:hypothetical protein
MAEAFANALKKYLRTNRGIARICQQLDLADGSIDAALHDADKSRLLQQAARVAGYGSCLWQRPVERHRRQRHAPQRHRRRGHLHAPAGRLHHTALPAHQPEHRQLHRTGRLPLEIWRPGGLDRN